MSDLETHTGLEGSSSPDVADASASRREPAPHDPHDAPGGAGSIILPLVEPAEAIAIGLSMVPSMGKRLLSPEGVEVRQVLLALKLAGYEIVPR